MPGPPDAACAPPDSAPLHRAPTGLLPWVVLLGAQLAVGSAAILARIGLRHGLGPWALSAWRLTLAALVVVGAQALRRAANAAPLPRPALVRLLIAGVCLGLHFAAWFASLRYVPVAVSTLLVTTAPVWAGIGGALFLRERPPARFWAGLAVAGVGAYTVTGAGGASAAAAPIAGHAWLGDLLAVAGAVAVAAYLLLVQGLADRVPTGRIVAWTYSAAAVFLWPAALVAESAGATAIVPHGEAAWLAVLGLALVPQVVGHTALNWSLKHWPAGAVSAATLLEPVIAGALAWALFGEALGAAQLAGGAVVLAGVALSLAPSRPAAAEQPSVF